MTLPVLLPRPIPLNRATTPQKYTKPPPSESDWEALASEIQSLYVGRRWKLRSVMHHIESRHGFKASNQMYKKKLAKWGLKKSNLGTDDIRLSTATDTSRMEEATELYCDCACTIREPAFSHRDSYELMLLTTVQSWSGSFFESLDSQQISQTQPFLVGKSPITEMSYAFKLISDLLSRGYGVLAGRLTRKAFVLAEKILAIEGPILVWNLLEMMHYIVTLHHVQLFHLLLAHLRSLTRDRMLQNHPLAVILQCFQALVPIPSSSCFGSNTSPAASLVSTPTSSSRDSIADTSLDATLFLGDVPFLLERAWILNAKIVFDHFDPCLIYLYYHTVIDSSSIDLPVTLLTAVRQSFCKSGRLRNDERSIMEEISAELYTSGSIRVERMLQILLMQQIPNSFLLETDEDPHCEVDIPESCRVSGSTNNKSMLLPLLAWLITDGILKEPAIMADNSKLEHAAALEPSRLKMGNLACAIKILIDLELKNRNGRILISPTNIQRIRTLIAVRGDVRGETDPLVVREMWFLRDVLAAAGAHAEAEVVAQEACCRIKKYVEEIPVNSA